MKGGIMDRPARRGTFKTRLSWKIVYSVFIAILPLLMFLRLPFTGFGLGTFFSLLFLPYAIVAKINSRRFLNRDDRWLILFFLYIQVRNIGIFSFFLLYGIAFIHVICAHASIDWKVLRKTVITVSVLSSVAILLQRLMLLAGIQVSFLMNALLLDEFQTSSSVYLGETLNRVSGVFVEPSHFAEYALIGLIMELITHKGIGGKNIDYTNAAVITVGILASTSGIGLIGLAAVLAYYILFVWNREKYPFILRLFILVFLSAAGAGILFAIPVTRLSIVRIFGNVDNYNPVWGRTVHLSYYLDQISGTAEWIFGKGAYEFEHYLLGFAKVVYQYGFIGLVLLFAALFSFILKKDRTVTVLCLLYGGFLFLTGLVGFLNYCFYFCVICSALSFCRNSIYCPGNGFKGKINETGTCNLQ